MFSQFPPILGKVARSRRKKQIAVCRLLITLSRFINLNKQFRQCVMLAEVVSI